MVNTALRVGRFEALAGSYCPCGVRSHCAEFNFLGRDVGPAAHGSFEDAAALQLRRNPEKGEEDLGKV